MKRKQNLMTKISFSGLCCYRKLIFLPSNLGGKVHISEDCHVYIVVSVIVTLAVLVTALKILFEDLQFKKESQR